jgi:hypothetical protein
LPRCLIHCCITPGRKTETECEVAITSVLSVYNSYNNVLETSLLWKYTPLCFKGTWAPINCICNNQCTIRKSIIDRWEQIIWILYYFIITRVTSQLLENLHVLTSLQHPELAFGGSFSGVVTTGRRHPVRKDEWEVKVL